MSDAVSPSRPSRPLDTQDLFLSPPRRAFFMPEIGWKRVAMNTSTIFKELLAIAQAGPIVILLVVALIMGGLERFVRLHADQRRDAIALVRAARKRK